MELVITRNGETRMIYQEEIDLSTLGVTSIQRASHVEPDAQGQWWADLSPVSGPVMGPYVMRKEALDSETIWIEMNVINCSH